MNDARTTTQDVLLRVAADARTRRFVESRTLGHGVVRRYVAGESTSSALDVAGELCVRGRRVSATYLASDPLDAEQAKERRKKLRKVVRRLGQAGLTAEGRVEVSVRLGMLGALLGPSGPELALEHVRSVARAATNAGTRVVVETEHAVPVDVTLDVVRELRQDFPDVGVALQACLRRTEADCESLADQGVRVRIARGTPTGADSHAGAEADHAFVRCLKVLMAAPGPVVVATYDERLLSIAEELTRRYGRSPASTEYQLRYGMRPERQGVIADRGDVCRVYLPFGPEWYPYLVSRLAEHPRDIPALLRAAAAR